MNDLYERFFKALGVKVEWKTIDDMIVSDANILRPVKGHAFEFLVKEIFKDKLNYCIKEGLGDTDVDLTVIDNTGKTYTIQIKTPVAGSIKRGKSFTVNLHKTHGLEKRPNNLYPIIWPCPLCEHEGEEFPDFLIVLHPEDGVVIMPKNKIPESTTFKGHYADPAKIEWDSEFLNKWEYFGREDLNGQNLLRSSIPVQEKFPQVSKLVNLTDEELIEMWLEPGNFRTLNMNLKGNLREPALKDFFKKCGYEPKNPVGKYPKYDVAVNNIKIQVKGFSKAQVDKRNKCYGVEVMGTHGKGAIRRYSETEFDYLGIVIEPDKFDNIEGLDHNAYHFCFVPIKALPLHYRNGYEWETKDKIYDVAKFKLIEENNRFYLIPNKEGYKKTPVFKDTSGNEIVRDKVSFRIEDKWEIDFIPFEKDSEVGND